MAELTMQLSVQCKGCEVEEALRLHCEEKLAHVERLCDGPQRAEVRFNGLRGRTSAEITLVCDGLLLRGEERGDHLRGAFDAAIHKLQRQLSDYKKKAQSAQRRHNNRDDATGTVLHPLAAPDIELAVSPSQAPFADADKSSDGAQGRANGTLVDGLGEAIGGDEESMVRVKRFALKPMSPDEAALQMDLLGHSFFVFRDSATNETSVVYKRAEGGYGLIEPIPA